MLTHARQFAIFWKEIGEMLKLEAYELKIIEMDNAYHPHKTKQCFRVMLEEWLKQGYLPTWEKFCNAIKGELSKLPYKTCHLLKEVHCF